MFHSAHIQVPNRQRRRTGLTTFFPSSSFSPPDSRETWRKGIVFCSVAVILLLVGSILTWLEYNNMFGGKISMTGPLLIALAFLMMLLSLRQFRLARKRDDTANNSGSMQMEAMNVGGMTTLVIDHDEGVGTTAVVLECDDGNGHVEGRRCHGEVGPPSYGDATYLDCSSTCPSFVSHDDHNEAPPTYEETCGVFIYGSETSLGASVSRRQSKAEALPRSLPNASPNLVINPQRSNTLSPSSALFMKPGARSVLLTTKNEAEDFAKHEASLCSSVSISSEETVTVIDSTPIAPPEQSIESENLKPQDWSRRSYSSIPSYTCLLSESGEVSSHVFNPSSIISQMSPNMESGQEMSASTSAPTRSQSASSINKLRQGVPYDLTITTSSDKIKTQLGGFSSSSHSVDSPTRRRSEGSRPNVVNAEGSQICGTHPKSDSSISHVHSSQPDAFSIALGQGSFDDGDSQRRNQGNNKQSDAPSIPSFPPHHSHDLLTQDIQETI